MPYSPDPMPFAGSPLDVMEHGRTAADIQAYLDDPNAKAFLFVKGRPAIHDDLTPITLHPKMLEGQTLFDPSPLFLGVQDTIPLFAYNLD